ncbi:MAG: LysM peptidoglycan-binding domain-containing protein, partial [Burkholderiales bacterium]|nr:LysM peptidoglycan-binding domain-containing protein [Burkholderiales bacterium]
TNASVAAQLNAQDAANRLTPQKFNDADLWERVRRGFVMEELNSPLVLQQEQWYATRPDYIQRFVDRGSKYLHHIVEEVEKRGMPMEVALLPIIESAFNPQAFSRAKASGMWQFIPSTGKHFGLKQDWMADNRRDVLLSTDAALDYLQKLYGMFNSWELAFAAYNCGEGCVGRAILKNQKKGLPTDYLSLNLPPETRSYLPKLIAVKNIILSPGSYGIELEAVENRPYFAKVTAPEKIDTNLAARLAEMPEAEFATLNPAFIRPVANSGTGYFLVPYEKAQTFRANLDLYRSLNGPMVSWQTINAKRGESIDGIAKRHGITGSYLRATNGALKENRGKLTAAATIMVPITAQVKIINDTFDQKVALKAAQPPVTDVPPVVTSATGVTPVIAALVSETKKPEAPAAIIPTAVASVSETTAPPGAHRVQRGETLFSISKRYGVTIDQIKTFNAMKTNSVQVGQNLSLSGVAIAEAALGSAPERLRVKMPANAAPSKPSVYTVRSGDTLYAIAVKFAVELDDLLRWNKLSAKSVLQPGNKIRVTL